MEVRIALMVPPLVEPGGTVDLAQFVDIGQQAEEIGFDAIWVGDHIVYPAPVLEPVVALSYLAGRTRTIRLGTCVMLVALRKPIVLAKELATLGVLSGERVDLGVGVGGDFPPEWAACEVPTGHRGRTTETAVAALRALLDGQSLDSDARFPHLHGVQLNPRPRTPATIFFGGSSPRALRRAARLGDGWVGWAHSPEEFATQRAIIGEKVDLGLNDFRTGMLLPTMVAEYAVTAENMVAQMPARFSRDHILAGDPEVVVGRMLEYYQAGCRQFGIWMLEQGRDLLTQLDLFGSVVIPSFRHALLTR